MPVEVDVSVDNNVVNIPNLNIPTAELSASSTSLLVSPQKSSNDINSPNKFEILSSQTDIDINENMASSSDIVGNALKQPGKGKKQATSEISKKSAKGKQSKKSQSLYIS
ncbi:hypothetical protein MA16_Dca001215 [Dendrobium catenatum]|uniref:Uncharacterized protein n=1 Tax=Dendrobium catenatum TaxID=906689 RepID=A0A2I0WLS6_9ASPA|nr:hypothetical protein MA16_Dca001215 [Dendrobium catenatum]